MAFVILTASPLTRAAPSPDSTGNGEPAGALSVQGPASQPGEITSGESNAYLHSEIESILRRPEFRLNRLTREREVPVWLRWLRDRWNKLKQALAGLTWLPQGASRWFLPAISVLLGLALLFMVYRIARESLFGGRGATQKEVTRLGAAPRQLLTEASRAADSGDYAEAIRLLFSAMLLLAFPKDGAHTPTRMLLRLLKAENAPVYQDLAGLNHLFEVHFYGGRPASPSGYQRATAFSNRITKNLQGGAGGPAS